MNQDLSFLEGTYWYVPKSGLPALQMSATDTEPTMLIDQTVWQITGSRYGYFWGNCAALLYEQGTEPTTAPNGQRLVGTVTPDLKVHMTFMPINTLGATFGTIGLGNLQQQNDEWEFLMQMSTGITDLTVHWSHMLQTVEDDTAWNGLPGTSYSVPDFLAAAGF